MPGDRALDLPSTTSARKVALCNIPRADSTGSNLPSETHRNQRLKHATTRRAVLAGRNTFALVGSEFQADDQIGTTGRFEAVRSKVGGLFRRVPLFPGLRGSGPSSRTAAPPLVVDNRRRPGNSLQFQAPEQIQQFTPRRFAAEPKLPRRLSSRCHEYIRVRKS